MRPGWFLILAFLLGGCQQPAAAPTQVRVAAAISTAAALKEIAREYEQKTGTVVIIDGQASSTLARQVEEGGPANLFLSADEAWADYLVEHQLVAQRCDLLSNHLVVVVNRQHPVRMERLTDLTGADVQRIAVADKEVPAGRYARQTLARAGLWSKIKDKVIQGGNVRATLMYVARGEADAGFVYATDAADSSAVEVSLTVPEELHVPIRYPLVLVRRESIQPEASALYDYLQSEAAGAVFRRHGFGFLP